MSGWQIDPAPVRAILTDVAGQVDGDGTPGSGLVGVVTPLEAQSVADGTWVAGDLLQGPMLPVARGGPGALFVQAVPMALAEVMDGVLDDMGKIANRVAAGVLGVSAAVQAYQRGQEDMCGAAEQAMAAAASSWDSVAGRGDFSWFVANGYLEEG